MSRVLATYNIKGGVGKTSATTPPSAADVERMGLYRTVIAEFAPHSRAALAYEELWSEIRARVWSEALVAPS